MMKGLQEGATKDVMRRTLVGKRVRVTDSRNPSYKGVSGQVRRETKNTLVIETGKGIKTLLKNAVTIEVDHQGKMVSLEGKKITKKIEEKLKIR